MVTLAGHIYSLQSYITPTACEWAVEGWSLWELQLQNTTDFGLDVYQGVTWGYSIRSNLCKCRLILWHMLQKYNYFPSVRNEDKVWFTSCPSFLSSHDKIYSLMATVLDGLTRKVKNRLSSEVWIIFQIPFGSEACATHWKHGGKRSWKKLKLLHMILGLCQVCCRCEGLHMPCCEKQTSGKDRDFFFLLPFANLMSQWYGGKGWEEAIKI